MFLLERSGQTGEMAQWVKCLLCKYEDMSSDLCKIQARECEPVTPVLGRGVRQMLGVQTV